MISKKIFAVALSALLAGSAMVGAVNTASAVPNNPAFPFPAAETVNEYMFEDYYPGGTVADLTVPLLAGWKITNDTPTPLSINYVGHVTALPDPLVVLNMGNFTSDYTPVTAPVAADAAETESTSFPNNPAVLKYTNAETEFNWATYAADIDGTYIAAVALAGDGDAVVTGANNDDGDENLASAALTQSTIGSTSQTVTVPTKASLKDNTSEDPSDITAGGIEVALIARSTDSVDLAVSNLPKDFLEDQADVTVAIAGAEAGKFAIETVGAAWKIHAVNETLAQHDYEDLTLVHTYTPSGASPVTVNYPLTVNVQPKAAISPIELSATVPGGHYGVTHLFGVTELVDASVLGENEYVKGVELFEDKDMNVISGNTLDIIPTPDTTTPDKVLGFSLLGDTPVAAPIGDSPINVTLKIGTTPEPQEADREVIIQYTIPVKPLLSVDQDEAKKLTVGKTTSVPVMINTDLLNGNTVGDIAISHITGDIEITAPDYPDMVVDTESSYEDLIGFNSYSIDVSKNNSNIFATDTTEIILHITPMSAGAASFNLVTSIMTDDNNTGLNATLGYVTQNMSIYAMAAGGEIPGGGGSGDPDPIYNPGGSGSGSSGGGLANTGASVALVSLLALVAVGTGVVLNNKRKTATKN